MSETYEPYAPSERATEPAPAPEAGEESAAGDEWCVIVEYSNYGDRKPPTLLDVLPGRHATHEEARAEAARQAFEYRPRDPMSPQERHVFALDDGYVAIIAGAMSTFHISIRPARFVGTADR